MSSRPSAGAHALVQRDAPVGAGSKEALTIMAPAGKDYRDLAVAAADAQVCSTAASIDVLGRSRVFALSLVKRDRDLCKFL